MEHMHTQSSDADSPDADDGFHHGEGPGEAPLPNAPSPTPEHYTNKKLNKRRKKKSKPKGYVPPTEGAAHAFRLAEKKYKLYKGMQTDYSQVWSSKIARSGIAVTRLLCGSLLLQNVLLKNRTDQIRGSLHFSQRTRVQHKLYQRRRGALIRLFQSISHSGLGYGLQALWFPALPHSLVLG
jgi:hypothetical protein